jgi:hypothetical protein
VLGLIFCVGALVTGVSAGGKSWVWVQPSSAGGINEQRVVELGFDYRGQFGSFALMVLDDNDVPRFTLECCAQCRVVPFATFDPSDELWVVESSAAVAAEMAGLLPATAMSFSNEAGEASFVLKQSDKQMIEHLSNKATFIPVSPYSVVLGNSHESNPIKAKWTTMKTRNLLEADPLVGRLVGAVDASLVEKTNRHLSSYFSRLAIADGAFEAQDWIEQYYVSLGLKVKTEFFRAGYSYNVIAELPGSEDPSKIVLIGAHYDSRSTSTTNTALRAPGSDDNGTGTSAVLELARVFALSGFKFKYTLRFCSWSGEEQGLLGSREHAKNAKLAGENIIAALNADMLGYRKPNTPLTIALVNRFTTPFLTEAAEVASRTYVPELTVGYTTAYCSDQQSFLEQGYPAMSYFETPGTVVDYPQYHRSTDLPEYVDFAQVGLITRAAAAALATFAEPITSQ